MPSFGSGLGGGMLQQRSLQNNHEGCVPYTSSWRKDRFWKEINAQAWKLKGHSIMRVAFMRKHCCAGASQVNNMLVLQHRLFGRPWRSSALCFPRTTWGGLSWGASTRRWGQRWRCSNSRWEAAGTWARGEAGPGPVPTGFCEIPLCTVYQIAHFKASWQNTEHGTLDLLAEGPECQMGSEVCPGSHQRPFWCDSVSFREVWFFEFQEGMFCKQLTRSLGHVVSESGSSWAVVLQLSASRLLNNKGGLKGNSTLHQSQSLRG